MLLQKVPLWKFLLVALIQGASAALAVELLKQTNNAGRVLPTRSSFALASQVPFLSELDRGDQVD